MNKPHLSELIFFWVLFAGAGLLSYFVLAPYIAPLFLGIVLAIVMRPIYRRLHVRLPGKPGLAAGLTTIAAIFIVLLPLAVGILLLVNELANFEGGISSAAQFLAGQLGYLQEYVHRFAPTVKLSLSPGDYVAQITSFLTSNIANFASSVATASLNAILALAALYFFLRDGHKLHAFALAWSPLPDKYDRAIITRIAGAVTAVVKGTLLTALLQGVIAGIGYGIFAAPNPTLWAVVTVFAAMIPMVGTALVTIPMAIVVGMQSGLIFGVGLLLWGVVVVGGVDNFIRPILIRGGLPIHPFIILLSVIGGIAAFGPMGFISGPIVLAFFFSLLELYPAIVQGKMEVLEEESKPLE